MSFFYVPNLMQQLKPGVEVNGYIFQGGDPDDEKSWLLPQLTPGVELNGFVFAGGNPDEEKNWLEKDAPRGVFGAVNDTVISAANMFAGGAQSISNFISPGNRVSKAIGEVIQKGEDSQSDQVKASRLEFQANLAKAVDAGEEIGAVLDYVADSPLQFAAQAVGAIALPGAAVKGTGLIARLMGGGEKVVQLAGRAGGVAAGAAMGGGDAAGSAYDAVMDTPVEIISVVPEFARLIENGRSEEEARQELATKAARKAAVLPALIGGAFGAVGVEKLLAGAGGYTGGVAARALKGFSSEGAQEAFEEGFTQFEGSRAAAEYNPEIDPLKGVAGAATMGAVIGGAMGGGVSALTPAAQPTETAADLIGKAKSADEAIAAAMAAQDVGLFSPKTAFQPPEVMGEANARIEAAAQGVLVQPDPVQQQLESAAQAGARLPNNPVNRKIGEIQQAIAARGGVATPNEASFLERYGAGKPYDRVATPEELNVPAPRAKIETPVSESIFVDGVSNSRGAVKVGALEPSAFQYDQVAQGKKRVEPVPASRVDTFIEQQRKTNTPAAQMLVSQFDRGQITREQIEQDLATKANITNQRVLTTDPIQARLESAAKAGTANATAPASGIVIESAFRRKNPITEKIKTIQSAIAERGGDPTEAEVSFLKRYEAFATVAAPAATQPTSGSPGTQAVSPEPAQPAATNKDWETFTPDTGTLNVPRAEMPQVNAENRGAMVNFLNARGVDHQQEEVSADSLKPTQAEFSREKVEKAKTFVGGDRSILVSGDGYVVDGHHQWLAKKENGEPVKVIRLGAPIADLLPMVREFPSSTLDESSAQPTVTGQPMADAAVVEIPLVADELPAKAPQPDLRSADAPQELANVNTNGAVADTTAGIGNAAVKQTAREVQEQAEIRRQAEKKEQRKAARAVEKAPMTLSVGMMPNTAEPVTVKDGVVYIGEEPAQDFETGDDVVVREDATGEQIRDALKAAGAVGNRVKFFGLNAAAKSETKDSGTENPVNENGEGGADDQPMFSRGDNKGKASASTTIGRVQFPWMVQREQKLSRNVLVTGGDVNSNIRREPSRDEVGVAELQTFADGITKGWANAPEVVVLDSLSDPATPSAVRRLNEVQKSQGASGEPRAFFYDGKVWLVNSQLTGKADAAEALFHEALGHYGLRGVFGKALNPVLNDLAKRRPELLQEKAEEYGLDLESNEGRLTAAEEVLAELAETRPEISFVRMAVAAVRTWLRNNVGFFDGLKLTNDEIVRNFIVPARDWVQKGRDGRLSIFRGTGGAQPSFSRTEAAESAEFKRWFGDWKLAQKAIMPRAASGLEDAKNIAQEFVGNEIVNRATKLVGTVSGNNLRKMTSQKAGDKSTSMMDHALAIANLDKLFENAVLDHSHPDSKGEPTIRAIHRYIAPMFGVDGSLLAVKLTVKETTGPNEPNPIYTVEAMEIESPPSVLSRANPDETGIRPQAGMKESVLDMLEEVNRVSKVVDADGKPLVVYHGTVADFDSFDNTKTGANDRGLWGRGHYFASSVKSANSYALRQGDGARVIPAYVSIQNPLLLRTGSDLVTRLPDGTNTRELIGENLDGSKIKDIAIKGGHDGVIQIKPNGSIGDVVAFRPEQIKSATGNNGTFDPANPDIRFSRAADKERASFKVEETGKLDNIIYKLQDKNVDLKRVTQAITKQTGELEDTINAYQKESLYHGKAAKQSKDFLDRQLKPLLDDMRMRKVDLQEFENYLWNRHAPERNEQIAKVNDRFPDGGSGIKTEDAARYMKGLPDDKRRHFEALAKRVDQMTRDNMQMMVDSGLEKQTTIDSMKGAYKHYVPLLRGESSSYNGKGQGFSIRGATTKRALGSDKPVENIISALADQREKIISRAQKAEVGRAVMGLALENPQDDFWFVFDPLLNKDEGQRTRLRDQLEMMNLDAELAEEISRQPYTEEMGPNGRVIRRPNRRLTELENALAVRINGEDKFVVLNKENPRAQRMAQALNNIDTPRLEGAISVVAMASRYFASINTQYNPIFGVVNLIRDTQGALFNLTSTKIAGKQAEVAKGILPAIRAIYKVSRASRSGGIVNGEWADLYERFQNVGGQTGFRDMFSTPKERTEKQLKAALDPSVAQNVYSQTAKPIFDWLSDYNETLENSVRLSAFKAALDSGLSDEQAASIAKELTVNFNRKGQVGSQMGAVYAFFNASTQGSARLIETLSGPMGKRIIAGGILLGAVQTLTLAMAGFDDEEPLEFVREKNLIIPVGGGEYATIPMPLGLHVLPNIGRIITEQLVGRSQKGVIDSVASLLGVVVNSFNPVGSSTFLQTLSPTVLDPMVALAENKDFTGRDIAREDFNPSKPTPGFTRTKANSIDSLVVVAKALNWLTGGSDYTKGLISPTPDQLEYVISQLTGGVGREISKVVQVGETSVTGEELPPYKMPLVGRFYGNTTSQSGQAGQFYENLRAMNDHKLEIKGRLEDGLSTMDYIKDNPEAMIFRQAESVERRVQELGRTKRKLKENGAGPESIKQVDEAITRVMSGFNGRVKQLRAVDA